MHDRKQIESMYYLSPLQEGLLFHRVAEGATDPYFCHYGFLLEGALEYDAFVKAWQRAVDRHPILRTGFAWEGVEKPLQIVRRTATLPIHRHDWRGLPVSERRGAVDALLHRDRLEGFDFLQPPLMRLHLIAVADNTWYLFNSHHHILLDGWSVALLLKEVVTEYESLRQGHQLTITPPPPYRDYIAWLSKQDQQAAEQFWRASLTGIRTPTTLPLGSDQEPQLDDQLLYAEQEIVLSGRQRDALRIFAQRHRLTINTVVQGAWAMLLSRYSGERDVLFGSTVSGRPAELADSDSMIGLFINTMPVRVSLPAEMNVRSWLQALQEQNSAIRQYEWTPLSNIQRWSEIPAGRPMFDTIVVFESFPEDESIGQQQGVRINPLSLREKGAYTLTAGRNNYPLSLMVEPGAELRLILCYARRRFRHGDISHMFKHYVTLLDHIVSDDDRRMADLSILEGEERRLVLSQGVASPSPESSSSCIHDLFERSVRMHPEQIAVMYEGQALTGRELDAKANRLASYLRTVGVGPEVLVGLCMERSLDIIVGLLAVLKAGGGYVPLDPKLPKDRVSFMLKDSDARVVLTQSQWSDVVADHHAVCVCLDRDWPEISTFPDTLPVSGVRFDHTAYVIYTSGSTGRPKGVTVEHRQVVNYVQGLLERLALPEEASFATVSTVGADLGNTSIFGALCSGRPLHVLSTERGFDPDAMAEYMHQHQVGVLKITPSHLTGLLEAGQAAWVLPQHCLILGGERSRPELIERIRALAPDCRIVNHYGPTETTVGVLVHQLNEVDDGRTDIPIGRPLANNQAYILDRDLHPMPAGLPGELYISGSGLSRGYLQRPETTAERFIPDPFGVSPGGRLYRTGDRARLQADGTIAFLGRVDNQVKVRGFRIELEEIDVHLRAEPAVKDAVTIVRETADGTQQLLSYVVGSTKPDVAAIRTNLARRLPDYMVPQSIVLLDSLPLTANGKLDRTALPDPSQWVLGAAESYVEPRNQVEEILAAIWKDVLRVERVGVFDNFFALGGDSIRTLQVIARANQRGVKLTPKQLFEHQTIAAAAAQALWKDAAATDDAADSAPVHSTAAQPFPAADSDADADVPMYPLTGMDGAELADLRDDWNDIEDCYPLSPMQEGMLFHTLMNPGTGMYLMQQYYVWDGRLDRDAFGRAWQRVVDRHPTLRTSFMWNDLKHPLQVVHRHVNAADVIDDFDWTDWDEDTQRAKMTELLEKELEIGFDLNRAPLMRIRLVRQKADRFTIVRSFHHILTDDWCFSLLMMDFLAHYEAFIEGRDLQAPLPPPYRDYIAWLQRQDLGAAEKFWRKELEGLNMPTPLGIERLDPETPAAGTTVGDVHMELSLDVSARIQALALANQVTPNTFVQGAWALLLSRYSGEEQVLFGVTVAGRPTELPGVEDIVGLFINTLPLRVTVSPHVRLIGWLKHLLAENYRLRQYEYAPLVRIQQWSDVPSGQPLFRSLVVFENAPKDPSLEKAHDDRVISFEQDRVHTNYPITVVGYPGDVMGVRLSYDRRVLDYADVERMSHHLKTLLEGMAAAPDAKLHELPMVGEEERRRVLLEWNQTDRADDIEEQFPALFEAQVARTPEAIAVQCGSHTLNYEDLNRAANRIAHALRALGTGPDTIVAVLDERGLALLSMIVGVLKAGGAYVPLDLHHPVERLAHMIAASRARVVVSRDGHAGLLAQVIARLPEERKPNVLSVEQMAMENWPEENLRPIDARNHLAYVIYTSGSTGLPKGAMVDCKGMLNHLTSKIPTLQLSRADVVAQTASQCFDISVWQFLTPLLCGARVQIVTDDVVRDPQRLLQEIAGRNVTVLEVVPSLLSGILECSPLMLPRLRWLLPTGEALSPELCRNWFSRYPNIPLVNAYGPAECSDDVAVARIDQMPDERATRMPIGRPIDRVRLYIVDRALEPMPAGVAGELCVSGVAVGRGYVRDPVRTAEVFVPDPFCLEGGGRLYRTGDLARHRSDGMIEFVGRRDHQVKIRGFRIELGEIEARLSQHPDVARSVVIAREDQPGRRQLVAYVVPAQALTADALRTFIKQALPDYMVPTAFVFLPALPLTPNGKIDRKALPAPEGDRTDERVEAPSTPTQDLVAGIWSEILGIERIGRHDQFFDLGGHSLLATQVISRVRAVFHVELPLRSLFDFPTVEGFAAAIDRAVAEGTGRQIPSLLPAPRTGPMPLSFAQQRLWFLWQLAPDSPMYNTPIALRITGVLDEGALRNSFDELARRHEVLRTTFPLNGDHPSQVIAPEPTHSLSVSDLRDVSPDEREAMVQSLTREEGRQLFDLSTGPLLRVRLLRIDDLEQVLLVTMHHIVSDGWSMAVLIEEMTELYTASVTGHPSPLPPLPIQYADYAVWQRKWMEGGVLEGQLDYWKKQLKDVPVFALPTDRPRPPIQTYRGAIHSMRLSADVTDRLKALSRRRGVTLFMTLLAVLNVLLKYETGHQDIVVGTDVTNRNRIEVEKLIGFFINQIVLRTTVGPDLGFQGLLDRVREVTLAAHAHQDVPFEMLVASLKAKRDLQYSPLFQIKLILQHVSPQPVELPGLAMSVMDNEKTTAQLDVLINFEESDDGLSGWFEYNTDLFDAASIVHIAGHFKAIVEQVVESPDATVEDLERILAERDSLQQTRTRQERLEVTSRNLKSIKRRAVGPSA